MLHDTMARPARPPSPALEEEPTVLLSDEEVAEIAKALGHPTRVHIVEFLEHGGPHMGKEIVARCGLAQSTVSEHLRVLRRARVLAARRDGPRTWYSVRPSVLHGFAEAVERLTD